MPGFGAGIEPLIDLIRNVRTSREDAWTAAHGTRDRTPAASFVRPGTDLERAIEAFEAALEYAPPGEVTASLMGDLALV